MSKTTACTYTYAWFTHQFEHAQNRAGKLVSETDQELLIQQPAPGKWSAVECLDHLVEFGNIYYDVIRDGIEKAEPHSAPSGIMFKPRLVWRWVIRFFEPPYKMKMKTINSFQPKDKNPESVQQDVDTFYELQRRFLSQIERTRQKGIDLASVKVPHPVLSFLKMTLSECLAIVDAHQRRHLWQAEQTVQKIKSADG